MTFGFWELIMLMIFGAVLISIGVILGAWIVFKSSRSVPGESFLGGVPKGEIFHITPPEEAEAMADEKHVLARTSDFLKKLVGE